MSFALKHIPCPAGIKCTAFHCIFGHADDQTPSQTTPKDAPARDGLHDTGETSANQQVPRKRFKTDSVQPASPSGVSRDPFQGSPRSNGITIDQAPASQKPESATRSISPPPLRRKAPLSKRKLQDSSSLPSSKSLSLSKQSSPSAAQTSKPVKVKKTESLNPRLLTNSPARHEIRLQLVRMLFKEFTRLNMELKKDAKGDEKTLVLTEQDLIVRALDEEEHLAVHKAAIYSNVMKNKVVQYKRMKVAQWKSERVEAIEKETQKLRPEQDSSDAPAKIITGLTPGQEVQLAKRLVTPINKLAEHGYVPIIPSKEAIEKATQGVEAAKGWEKCDRCQQRFQVFPGRREIDGALTSGGSCTFHWGKTYIAPKNPGDRARQPKRYACCGQEIGDSAGCFTRDHHVFKTTDSKRLASILNFAETPENLFAPENRAVAFDCEMGYTVYGLELIRLTATSWPTGEELLDVLVRPLGEILDLNSRYSGVWPEDLAQAKPWTGDDDSKPSKSGAKSGDEFGSEEGEVRPPKKQLKIVSSPEVARDLLFSLMSPRTPLIGHGLENDLNAVRIVHPTLIDTVLLYPHKGGLPFRYGLKMLMEVHLNRKIQQESGPKMLGHDSAEDARAAGDLVRLKLRNEWMDLQRLGWKLVDGRFVAPAGTGGKLTEDFIEA
ncbi:hypothetical protein G7046_g6977 [Stylonectria norvegica]|nr:hypothetical protein G7046_g6977 [Stylonectria norvegica]